MINATIASRAILMFWNDPRMWILLQEARGHGPQSVAVHPSLSMRSQTHVSASTTLVLLAFSMANLVRPSLPAIRPIARERWSP
jgi:hypothetical protein